MPGTLREIQKPGLPHLLSTVCLLYHLKEWSARGKIRTLMLVPSPRPEYQNKGRAEVLEQCSGAFGKDSHGRRSPRGSLVFQKLTSPPLSQIARDKDGALDKKGTVGHGCRTHTTVTAGLAMARCCRIGRNRFHEIEQMGLARRSKGTSPLLRAMRARSSCCSGWQSCRFR